MEERAVSPAHEEEVVELLDIVQSAEAAEGAVDEGGEVVELAPEDIEAFAEGEEEPLMLVDVLSRGDEAEQGEALPLDRLVLPGNAEEPCGTGDAPQAQEAPAPEEAPSFVEEAAFERFAAELDERFLAIEERQQAEAQASEQALAGLRSVQEGEGRALHERLSALQQAFSAEMQALRAEFAPSEEGGAEVQALAQRLDALGERLGAEMQALQASLASSLSSMEERLAVLDVENAELRKALSESPSALLADSSLHMALEEMVGRMIEARMAALSDAGVQESAPAEEAAPAASAEALEALAGQMKSVEERVERWEQRCEQEASLAAARVIREEIAAMRAGAARMAH